MELLQNGVDPATVALCLGNESVETTYIHLHADLAMKERAMAQSTPVEHPTGALPPPRRGPSLPERFLTIPSPMSPKPS